MAAVPRRDFCYCRSLSTHILVFLLFVLIGLLLYRHTLHAPFYVDDFINIKNSLHAISSLSLHEVINRALSGFARHRPLANLSFSLNYYFHGLNLPGYHLVNIFIHVVNGILLYLFVFKTITLPVHRHHCRHPVFVASLATLLWFVNPMQIQAVTYIIQRMTSMATLFLLCSFLSYIYGRLAAKTRIRVALFCLSGLCWILSVASKEIGLMLPVLVFVYEWFFFQDLDRTWLKTTAVYLAAGLGGLMVAIYLIYGYSPLSLLTAISQLRGYTAFERFLTEGRVIFVYIGLLLYPHPSRLTLNHDIAVSRGLFDPFTTVLSFAGLFALLVLAVLLAKRYRLAAFCIIWFFANVALESLAAGIELIFEHRVYLASMLFFLPFVWMGSQKVGRPGRVILGAITALAVVFSFWTYERNALWNDPVAFWEDAVRKSPNHHRAHFNLGASFLEIKAYDRAMVAFKKSLTLSPPYPGEAYTNIGAIHLAVEEYEQARENLNRAIELHPNNYMARNLLANLKRKQGSYNEALKHYLAAIRINPNFAPSYHNVGVLYMDMEEFDKAVEAFQRAINLRPRFTEAYSSLGLAQARQGHYDLAIPTLQKATRLDPENQEALFNLATAFNTIGRHEQAALAYEALLKVNQTDVEAMHNLGMIYLKHLKDMRQAEFYFRKALSTDPDYGQAATVRDILSQIAVSNSQ